MKKIGFIFLVLLLLSCGSFKTKQFEATYEFVDIVTEKEKKETVTILKKRLKKITQADIIINENKISIVLYDSIDINSLNSIILNEGKLDFHLCWKNEEISPILSEINYFKEGNSFNHNFISISDTDTLGLKNELINTNAFKSQGKFNDSKFLYGIKKNGTIPLYAVKKKGILINENHIAQAYVSFDALNRPAIGVRVNDEKVDEWENITKIAYESGRSIAIVLNNVVITSPRVASGPISGGRLQISSDFTLEEAQNLAAILNSQGRIPKLKFIDFDKISNQ